MWPSHLTTSPDIPSRSGLLPKGGCAGPPLMSIRDEKLELYEKYALADAVATLAIVEDKFFNEPTLNGFHHRGL